MGSRIPVIIADDEQNICEMLRKLIQFDRLGLELVHMATNGEDLRRAIVEKKPGIVITDIRMPVMDGLEVIRWCNENGYKTSFVVLSGYHQFEYAYNALKYRVNDYLLKPVNENELNETLERIAEGIRKGSSQKDNSAQLAVLRDYFMKNVSLRAGNGRRGNGAFRDIDAVNREFMLNLSRGAFRFIYLRVDDQREEKRTDEQVTSVVAKLREMTGRRLSQLCYDYVIQEEMRGIRFFVNYDPELKDELERELKELYEEARALADIFSGMHITMGIGDAVFESADISLAEEYAWDALFCRFGIGTNKMIWYTQLGKAELEASIKGWNDRIRHAWDILDENGLTEALREMFALPRNIKTTRTFASAVREVSNIIDECRDGFFQRTGLEPSMDRAGGDRSGLNDANSFEEYRDRMLQIYGTEIRECVELVDKKDLKPIRLACNYVAQHHTGPIKLEDVAEAVGLNPAYFSTLFAKKTGQNFTEYVTLFKMKKACELLLHSDMNINEIADSLGFQDARYFSKLFRKKMGLKPTEYRRIYG